MVACIFLQGVRFRSGKIRSSAGRCEWETIVLSQFMYAIQYSSGVSCLDPPLHPVTSGVDAQRATFDAYLALCAEQSGVWQVASGWLLLKMISSSQHRAVAAAADVAPHTHTHSLSLSLWLTVV